MRKRLDDPFARRDLGGQDNSAGGAGAREHDVRAHVLALALEDDVLLPHMMGQQRPRERADQQLEVRAWRLAARGAPEVERATHRGDAWGICPTCSVAGSPRAYTLAAASIALLIASRDHLGVVQGSKVGEGASPQPMSRIIGRCGLRRPYWALTSVQARSSVGMNSPRSLMLSHLASTSSGGYTAGSFSSSGLTLGRAALLAVA